MLICHIKNLENKVGSQDYFSKNDLFVSIYCNGKIHKTITIWDKNNPVWNSIFVFETSNREPVEVKFCLYDEDKYGKDEIISKETIIVDEKFEGKCVGVNVECYFADIINDETKKIINNLKTKNSLLNEENTRLKDFIKLIKQECTSIMKFNNICDCSEKPDVPSN
jgi:Ca2+-dependent lipid-binding protein